MAQRVSIVLEDDIDGGPADTTVHFTFEGTSYEIDLSEQNASDFRTQMSKWITAGRKVSGRRSSRKARPTGPTTAEIRDWAVKKGHKVSDRGRISAEIRAAYEAAHS